MERKEYTLEVAEQIKQLLRERKKATPAAQKGIRAKIRKLGFYISDFGDGFSDVDFENEVKAGNIIVSNNTQGITSGSTYNSLEDFAQKSQSRGAKRADSDECYVIDLCDEVLGLTSFRQHKFDFLVGDKNERGQAAKLPVDGFYQKLNLVIEYREKQHTESVEIFDERPTVSGVSRGEQRKIYDERRRTVLPQHGLTLIEISYSDFKCNNQKRIIRNKPADLLIVKNKLSRFLPQ